MIIITSCATINSRSHFVTEYGLTRSLHLNQTVTRPSASIFYVYLSKVNKLTVKMRINMFMCNCQSEKIPMIIAEYTAFL